MSSPSAWNKKRWAQYLVFVTVKICRAVCPKWAAFSCVQSRTHAGWAQVTHVYAPGPLAVEFHLTWETPGWPLTGPVRFLSCIPGASTRGQCRPLLFEGPVSFHLCSMTGVTPSPSFSSLKAQIFPSSLWEKSRNNLGPLKPCGEFVSGLLAEGNEKTKQQKDDDHHHHAGKSYMWQLVALCVFSLK